MNDIISRQAAIDAIHCDITIKGKQNAEVVAETIASFVDRIKALPSAHPERERGKWDTFFSDSYKVHKIGVECSCCGYRTQERTNYCPRCGADMRGEENG